MATNSPNTEISFESLEVCLETYLKCLNFDFVAILLNETLEEPSRRPICQLHRLQLSKMNILYDIYLIVF